ncbi:MAG: PP2C family protein-serine/threonine phosphatase [Planctomycetota bacterium]
MAQPTFTSEFTHEFEAETGRLLRKRFLWFLGTMLALWVIEHSVALIGWKAIASLGTWMVALTALLAVADLAVYGWLLQRVRGSRPEKPSLLRLTRILLIYFGCKSLFEQVFIPIDIAFPVAMISFGFAFLMAAVFLPWSPREVFRTVAIVTGLHLVVFLWQNLPPNWSWLWIATFPVFLGPGFAVTAVKHSSRMKAFKMRFLAHRYGEVRREMTDARRIHEDLFPEPRDVGDLCFRYLYQPMRQIGGDFLFFHESPGIEGRIPTSCVLLDVTGHGLAAALTVNRLHGELERIFAEEPNAEPGRVLTQLNRYVHLTLAQHSIYASAVCMRVDPVTSELTYASAGHPPAFLRGVDGTVEELHSTTLVLGACAPADFLAEAESRPFGPGDLLIAYTDGAMEARNEEGRIIGRQWLMSMVAGADCGPGEWPKRVVGELDARRHGPPEDDTLVIEIHRLLERDAGSPEDAEASHATR